MDENGGGVGYLEIITCNPVSLHTLPVMLAVTSKLNQETLHHCPGFGR